MRRFGLIVSLLSAAAMLAYAASLALAQAPSPARQAQSAPPSAARSQAPQPTIAPPAPLTLRVEAIPPVDLRNAPSSLSLKDFTPSLGAFIGLIGALMAVWISGRVAQRNNQASIEAAQRNAEASIGAAQRNNEAALWQKANETELKDIQGKLDGFYGPFLQLSGMNGLLAREFRNRQPDKNTFRLLRSVFDRQWLERLTDGDKIIVREICNNASLLETFLKEESAMVDMKVLPYLFRASAHFRILHLAYKGELGTDPTHFLRYVYPQQLDKVLELEVQRLQRRSELLRANPSRSPGPLEPLNIPPDLSLPDWPAAERRVVPV